MNNTNEPAGKYILTKELELCEHCEELKRVIVVEHSHSIYGLFDFMFFPLQALWKIVIFPYYILKKYATKNRVENNAV